eukprot:COSAG02_NODE_41029_length_399_cov_0.520000_1_plen_67_part_10
MGRCVKDSSERVVTSVASGYSEVVRLPAAAAAAAAAGAARSAPHHTSKMAAASEVGHGFTTVNQNAA